MSVISGAFPDTYGILYMTVNCWCIWGLSHHRHGAIALGEPLARYYDGDDAHDGPLWAYSKEVALLHFGGHYPFNLPDVPDAQSK